MTTRQRMHGWMVTLALLSAVAWAAGCAKSAGVWDQDPCTDNDGDGYGAGDECLGPDCNDDDAQCFNLGDACCTPTPDCTDVDGDGYGIGADCLGPDCNDDDDQCYNLGDACCTPTPDCIDDDGDGYGIGADCQGLDCNDDDDQCWEGDCCNPSIEYSIKVLEGPWPVPPECQGQSDDNVNASAINELGDAVGVAERVYWDGAFCHNESHAMIWHADDTITDCGGIPPRTGWSAGKGINDNGDAVVGFADFDIPGGIMSGPSYWNPTDGMINITDGHQYPAGWAWGVNNAHQVALQYRNQPHYWDAVEGLRLICHASWHPACEGDAWEINNNGLIAGYAKGNPADIAELHAYKYDSATDTITNLHPPSDPLWYISGAYGLNDNGDVAGWMQDYAGFQHPAIWTSGGGLIILPHSTISPSHIFSHAEHINDPGDVVGFDSSVTPGVRPYGWVAFDVLNGGTTKVALEALLDPADAAQWEIWYAFEINNSKQIVGFGIFNGNTRGFVMTPL